MRHGAGFPFTEPNTEAHGFASYVIFHFGITYESWLEVQNPAKCSMLRETHMNNQQRLADVHPHAIGKSIGLVVVEHRVTFGQQWPQRKEYDGNVHGVANEMFQTLA